MENEVEFYYEKLGKSVNPGQDLLEFYREVTGKQDAGRSEVIMLNRLLKLFGRFTVFYSVLDLSKIEKLEGNLYPLLYTICKNRFERIHLESFSPSHESLERMLNAMDKEIEQAKKSKGKYPPPEGLE